MARASELFRCDIVVRKSPIHGYGVFARQDILSGEVIEECQILFADYAPKEYKDYRFSYPNDSLVLGYGSTYNHSTTPNASYAYNDFRKIMVFKAKRFINKGEEIFISYGPTWFTSRHVKPRETWKFYAKRLLGIIFRVSLIAILLAEVIIFLKTS